MKALIQRVRRASVTVEGEIVGEIANGFLVLLGVGKGDEKAQVDWLVDKILALRVFEDEDGKMNKSIMDVEGSLLVVSQFTLYANCKKGTRPSFVDAAEPAIAKEIYAYSVETFREKGVQVETGVFGAHMDVSLINDGPVTIMIETP